MRQGFALTPPGPTEDAPWVPLPLLLTAVSVLIDANNYLALGQVFVADITGNLLFLGFAALGQSDFSAPAPPLSLAGFLVAPAEAGCW